MCFKTRVRRPAITYPLWRTQVAIMRRAIGAAAAAGLLMLASLQGAAPVTAWVNGHWFDGTRFREMTVYSDGERLTLKRPAAISQTVDLGRRFVTGAFAEAHNHNVPGIDAKASVREPTWTTGSSTS